MRVRIEGRDLQRLRLTLIGPDGQTALPDDGATHAGQSMWIAAYPTVATAASLAHFQGWQPEGAWTLRIDNGGAEAKLVESAVVVRSWFTTDAATPSDPASNRTIRKSYLTSGRPNVKYTS